MKNKSILALLIAGLVAAGAWAAPVEEEAAMVEEMSPIDMLAKIDHSAWERGSHGGRFVVTNIAPPKTFNDIVAKETSTTDITGQMYAGVVRRSQLTLEWEPGLAERWEISEDQKTITLHLRSGLVWSDGDPITADEIVWSVNEIYKNEEVETSIRNALNVGGELAEFELIDDLTYRVVLPSVYAGIFEIASIGPMPRHIFEPLIEAEGAAAVNSFWGVDTDVSTIVGNGPFLISEYLPSQRVVMTPNPNYYEKDEWGQQLPYLDEFVIEFVEDQDTNLARFIAGETDAMGAARRGLRRAGRAAGVRQLPDLQRRSRLQHPVHHLQPEPDRGRGGRRHRASGADLAVQQELPAGDGAPDRSRDHHQQHRLRLRLPAVLVRLDGLPYYWEGAPDAALTYDPERAKELLDSIGYTDRDGDGFREDPDGNKIELILNTNSGNTVREQIGELFTQEAQAAGIDVTFKPEAFNELVTRLVASYDWHMILIGLTGSVDPVSGANGLSVRAAPCT